MNRSLTTLKSGTISTATPRETIMAKPRRIAAECEITNTKGMAQTISAYLMHVTMSESCRDRLVDERQAKQAWDVKETIDREVCYILIC